MLKLLLVGMCENLPQMMLSWYYVSEVAGSELSVTDMLSIASTIFTLFKLLAQAVMGLTKTPKYICI